MNFKHNPSHPVHCFCRECTGHYAEYMARRRGIEGRKLHLALEALEAGESIALGAGLGEMTSLELGLTLSLAMMGLNSDEIATSLKRLSHATQPARAGIEQDTNLTS